MQQQTWIDSILAMPWIAWSVGGVLIALGLFLLWLFLFSDRSRGRRRCPKCWYDLRGTPGLRCSECGFEARRERALFRTRRRWRAASAAMLVLALGIAVALVPKVRRDGWPSLVPTTALLWLMPLCDAPDYGQSPLHWTESELDRRDAARSLSAWQWRFVLIERGGVRFRRVWPADTPLVVEAQTAKWGQRWRAHIRELPIEPTGNWWNDARRVRVGPVAVGAAVELEVSIGPTILAVWANPSSTAWSEPPPYWTGRVDLPIRIVPTIHEAMTRRAGLEFDQLIRCAIQLQATVDDFRSGGRARDRSAAKRMSEMREMMTAQKLMTLWCTLNRSVDERLKNLAFGFQATVRKAGEHVQTLRFDPLNDGFNPTRPGHDPRFSASFAQTTMFAVRDLQNGADWTFELRGDPERALRDWDRMDYWDGSISLNVGEIWVEGRDSEDSRTVQKE